MSTKNNSVSQEKSATYHKNLIIKKRNTTSRHLIQQTYFKNISSTYKLRIINKHTCCFRKNKITTNFRTNKAKKKRYPTAYQSLANELIWQTTYVRTIGIASSSVSRLEVFEEIKRSRITRSSIKRMVCFGSIRIKYWNVSRIWN